MVSSRIVTRMLRQSFRPFLSTVSSFHSNDHSSRQSRSWCRVALATSGVVGMMLTATKIHCKDIDDPRKRMPVRRNDSNVDRLTMSEWMMSASMNDHYRMGQMIKDKKIDVNMRHPFGFTALHVAAFNGCREVVSLLLQHGADINIRDEFSTAQNTAHVHGVSIFDVIASRDSYFGSSLRHNANFAGSTPLHYAALAAEEHIIADLLNAGVDPTIVNQSGHSPIDYLSKTMINPELEARISKAAQIAEKERKTREAAERRRFPLEKKLAENLVGQTGAITAVGSAIRRRQSGWDDDEHPLVMLFLGSSGIGKTELAKQVAAYLHSGRKPKFTEGETFIRFDMSEYQMQHEVAKFIGSPPGYVGHSEGGQLTKALTKCPDAVVLFDEIEKAHNDILTILLQLFDEGRLTDGQGKTIQCKRAIFIMTSNLAQTEIADHAQKLRYEADQLHYARMRADDIAKMSEMSSSVTISRKFHENSVQPILKAHFKRDEFLGRINEFVYFLPFSPSELAQLVRRELDTWKQRALLRHQIEIRYTPDVIDEIVNTYNIRYGARSIKHSVERSVINKLALAHEQGLIDDGSIVELFVDDKSKKKDSKQETSVAASENEDDDDRPIYQANIHLREIGKNHDKDIILDNILIST